MATKNIVPRADNEGQLGTAAKRWADIKAALFNGGSLSGNNSGDGAVNSSAIANTLVNAKGDIIGASANDTPVITPVGTDGKTLIADSSQAGGLGWGTHTVNAASVAAVAAGFAADTYLVGSGCTLLLAGGWAAGSNYYCAFDMTKTAAGIATPIITVRMGILGTTGDAAIMTITFGAGTAAVDTGLVEVWINFRSVGTGTAAVIQTVARITHALAATGLTSTGAAGSGVIVGTSAGFNSSTQTKIGLSFNGGASFSGTNTLVQGTLNP